MVLIDVIMPGMGGIEATRRLSSDCPHARVIGLSMHESDEVERAMRAAGTIAFLRKNDSRERLLNTIRDTVTGGHAVD